MSVIQQSTIPNPLIRTAGGIAILIGIISTVGILFLIGMFFFFSKSQQALGETFGMVNDICVALQYLLTIPVALILYHILGPYNPGLIRIGTIIGIFMMLVVAALQFALIFGLIPFEKQVVWVSLAMIVGVGSWLVITGLVARSTGKLPNSVLMSSLAVPYIGYPVWAVWLGLQLLGGI